MQTYISKNVELTNSFNGLNENGDSLNIFLIWFCALLRQIQFKFLAAKTLK